MYAALAVAVALLAPVQVDDRPCAEAREYREVQRTYPGTKGQVDRIYDSKGTVVREGRKRMHVEYPTCGGGLALVVYEKPNRDHPNAKLWILVWWDGPA